MFQAVAPRRRRRDHCHQTVGSTVMKVADVMTRGVISITPESSVTKAARMMLLYDISGLPVIDSSGGSSGS
jgi:CBS domain-containing protein